MNPNNISKEFYNKKTIYENITQDNIDSLTKDSPIHLLNALYQCEDYILLDENKEAIVNKKSFTYKSSFYLSFLSNQDSISEEYLQARKALYKSVNLLKKDKTFNFYNNSYTFQSQDKSIQIIFLDKNISMSHLLHIHNNKIDIFTKDKTYLDIQELESLLQEYVNTNTESNNTKQDSPMSLDILNSPSTQIFFYSHLLLGSSEIESNPFLFGELDKDNTIKQDTPTYHFSPKDEENNLGTLTIFLNASTLTLLNYSLLDSSLNIKLELTNKESKEKQDKAIIQREQKQHKEQSKPLSTAMLHPILEDNEMKCSHGGVVQLKSNLGKSIQDKNIPFILETDLLYSSIVGCPNPPLSGGPCTQVALILPSARGLKKHNEDYPIMQDLVSSGVFSDKGVPLICIPKPNSYKINAPSPTHTKNITKEALKAQIEFHKPILRLHYKEHKSQQDNLPITRFYLFDNLKEQESPFENLILDYQSDAQGISDKDLEKELLQSYPDKEYQHKQINLQFGVHQIHLVFIIPQSLPKLFKEYYKNYKHKDYGIGKYKPLFNYSKDITTYTKITDSKDISLQSISITHTRVFLSPFKANKLNFTFALGLDDWLDKDNITELKIVIGGVYDEEREVVKMLQDKLYTLDDAKEALKIVYNKYGEEMARIIEKMYRSETAHFSSGQYKHTGTGGMEVFGNAPYYGWDSKFFEQNPNYKPTGVWSAFESKGLSEQGGNAQVKDRKKQFVVMPSVLAGMEYKAYYINKHNGNWARWHSTQTQAQEAYKKAIEQIKARIVDEIVGKK